MKHTPQQRRLWEERPYSWSQHSSFLYDPAQWYDRYLLGNSTPGNPAMSFGNQFALKLELGEPMAPVEILSHVEYKMEAVLSGIKLIGFADSYEPHTRLREYKTGKTKWTQKRVDEHGQLTFYALLLYLAHQVDPKQVEMALQWIPTCEQPDFTFGFALDKDGGAMIHTFRTKRTMAQVLKFGNEIKATRAKMLEVIHSKEVA